MWIFKMNFNNGFEYYEQQCILMFQTTLPFYNENCNKEVPRHEL